jgi:hypothetical protein
MKPEVPGKTNSLAEETFEEASRPLARRSVLKGALVSAPLLLVGPSPGTITILLRGDEGHKMLDNVTIDRRGRILMDEDPGNSDRVSKIWM